MRGGPTAVGCRFIRLAETYGRRRRALYPSLRERRWKASMILNLKPTVY